MPKTIQSPSKRWSGSVTISDPLTLPQAEALSEGLSIIREYGSAHPDGIPYIVIDKAYITGILPCVETWQLNHGFPEKPTLDTFPMSPQPARRKLVEWLWDEIYNKIYMDDKEIPNE